MLPLYRSALAEGGRLDPCSGGPGEDLIGEVGPEGGPEASPGSTGCPDCGGLFAADDDTGRGKRNTMMMQKVEHSQMAAASMHSANSEYNLSRNAGVEVCRVRVSFFKMMTASDVSIVSGYSAPKIKSLCENMLTHLSLVQEPRGGACQPKEDRPTTYPAPRAQTALVPVASSARRGRIDP